MIKNCTWGKTELQWKYQSVAIKEIHKISASEQFVYEDLIAQLLTLTVGHVMVEINVSLLFNGELENNHFDTVS
jgi:hypothetical protein